MISIFGFYFTYDQLIGVGLITLQVIAIVAAYKYFTEEEEHDD